MWRRHPGPRNPSLHALRATCLELLPLVEMYCRWELLDDCIDLRSLMLRFNSEQTLQESVLGRSLLLMLRNDDTGLQILPQCPDFSAPVNPFDAVRNRLAAVDLALRGLHAQVHSKVADLIESTAAGMRQLPNAAAVCMCSVLGPEHFLKYNSYFPDFASPFCMRSRMCTICVKFNSYLHSVLNRSALHGGGYGLPFPLLSVSLHNGAWNHFSQQWWPSRGITNGLGI